MASPRITKEMRENITANAIRHRFTDDVYKLSVSECSLAERAYHIVFSNKDIEAMEQLGRGIIRPRKTIALRVSGEQRTMCFNGQLVVDSNKKAKLRFSGIDFDTSHDDVEFLMPERISSYSSDDHEAYWERFTINRDNKAKSKFCDDVLGYDAERDNLMSSISETETKLSSLLESVQTFKKLRAIWPEGAQFYDQYDVDHTLTPKVPAVIITDINKSLGI